MTPLDSGIVQDYPAKILEKLRVMEELEATSQNVNVPETGYKQLESDSLMEADDLVDIPLDNYLVGVTDQTELEQSVGRQMMKDIRQREAELERKRLRRTVDKIRQVRQTLESHHSSLRKPGLTVIQKKAIYQRITDEEAVLATLLKDEREINDRLKSRSAERVTAFATTEDASTDDPLHADETERERLIRLGKITPFDALNMRVQPGVVASENSSSSSRGAQVADLTAGRIKVSSGTSAASAKKHNVPSSSSSQMVKRKRIADVDSGAESGSFIDPNRLSDEEELEENVSRPVKKRGLRKLSSTKSDKDTEEDCIPEDEDDESVDEPVKEVQSSEPVPDDGDELSYQTRLASWVQQQLIAEWKQSNPNTPMSSCLLNDQNHVTLEDLARAKFSTTHRDDLQLEGGYTLPGSIHSRLFPYQRTCVRWLWELHMQQVGGVVGDEMGLGKTVQVVSYLAGLDRSQKRNGPILIVAPATVLRQWADEFREWAPWMRCVILHSSGSGFVGKSAAGGSGKRQRRVEDDWEFDSDEDDSDSGRSRRKGRSSTSTGAKKEDNARVGELLKRVVDHGHVIVTTYEGIRVHKAHLLPARWSYCVLDEGHKIRNADADITILCKQVKTPHRIILSGTPIQNNLKELWSVYDFVYPGRLGTLPVFLTQFEVPIRIGAYANATNLQVQTSQRCAMVLRDLISPYLLRRMKTDVASDLPKKTEQVLFCRLTKAQRELYERFLQSDVVSSILQGKRNALSGIDGVRKICNHPDLLLGDPKNQSSKLKDTYGDVSKSGKMMVTRQMQDILEKFVRHEGYKYRRMDGMTQIKSRITMVDEFNADPSIEVFLLTTRVGGLGINLTGANRVIIFDPDWNPSTDVQARERAWRLGQTRPVTVYRLMMSGTIEEKIYHRQIYKQFLTGKILSSGANGAASKRFFDSKSIKDLFVLDDERGKSDSTETGRLFKGAETLFPVTKKKAKETEKLQGIKGLAAVEAYQAPKPTGPEIEGEDQNNEETRMLSELLHSTVAHDHVLAANSDSARSELDRQAKKVADEAANQVRLSRRLVRAEQKRAAVNEHAQGGSSEPPFAGLVTWTGAHGTAGSGVVFGKKSSGNAQGSTVSSKSLLDNLRNRKQ